VSIKVIMSCDDNPYYLDFWHLVSYVWKEKMGLQPVLVHVGESDATEEYGEVHKIKVDEEIPIHTQAQMSRMWYTHKEPDTRWVTSDIDMIPTSKQFWDKFTTDCHSFDWINLNSVDNYFPICYNIALGRTFKDVLDIDGDFHEYVTKSVKSVDEDLKHTPENWNGEEMSKWNVDEVYSSRKISEFRDSGGKVFQPPVPINKWGRRIDRSYWGYDDKLLKEGFYIDCHSLRPLSLHEEEINRMVDMI
jgi:hypothetical protein